jgi:hypothetical protein
MQIQRRNRDLLILGAIITLNAFLDTFAGLFLPLAFTSSLRTLVLVITIFYFYLNRVKYDGFVRFVIFFLIFYLGLTLLSSDIPKSFARYSKFAISISFLPIGYAMFKSQDDLRFLNNAMVTAAAIITMNVIFSTLAGVDTRSYADDSGYSTGNMVSAGLFTGVYFVILSPLIISLNKRNSIRGRIVVLLIIAIVIINILTLKRSTILAIGVGILVYTILNKQVFNTYVFIAILGFVAATFLFTEIFASRVERREKKLQVESLTLEARYLETVIIVEDIISFKDPKYSLIGKELFNTIGNYGDGIFGGREIHNDYMIVLNGSGIIGMFLYMFLFMLIYGKFNKTYRKLKKFKSEEFKQIYVFIMVLLAVSLTISLNGGISSIGFRTISFLYIGAFLGIVDHQFKTLTYASYNLPAH